MFCQNVCCLLSQTFCIFSLTVSLCLSVMNSTFLQKKKKKKKEQKQNKVKRKWNQKAQTTKASRHNILRTVIKRITLKTVRPNLPIARVLTGNMSFYTQIDSFMSWTCFACIMVCLTFSLISKIITHFFLYCIGSCGLHKSTITDNI